MMNPWTPWMTSAVWWRSPESHVFLCNKCVYVFLVCVKCLQLIPWSRFSIMSFCPLKCPLPQNDIKQYHNDQKRLLYFRTRTQAIEKKEKENRSHFRRHIFLPISVKQWQQQRKSLFFIIIFTTGHHYHHHYLLQEPIFNWSTHCITSTSCKPLSIITSQTDTFIPLFLCILLCHLTNQPPPPLLYTWKISWKVYPTQS